MASYRADLLGATVAGSPNKSLALYGSDLFYCNPSTPGRVYKVAVGSLPSSTPPPAGSVFLDYSGSVGWAACTMFAGLTLLAVQLDTSSGFVDLAQVNPTTAAITGSFATYTAASTSPQLQTVVSDWHGILLSEINEALYQVQGGSLVDVTPSGFVPLTGFGVHTDGSVGIAGSYGAGYALGHWRTDDSWTFTTLSDYPNGVIGVGSVFFVSENAGIYKVAAGVETVASFTSVPAVWPLDMAGSDSQGGRYLWIAHAHDGDVVEIVSPRRRFWVGSTGFSR